MNTINFNQVGGFPLTTNILAKLQTAFSIFNAFGAIVGDLTIISGCIVTGVNVSDGFVYINGEILEFKGGPIQSKVIVKEDIENLVFQNSNAYQSIKIRYVQFGTGLNAINWSEFKRGFATKDIAEQFSTIFLALDNKANASLIAPMIARIGALEARPVFSNVVRNKGYFTLGDVFSAPAGTALPVSGDCTSAIIAAYDDPGNSYINVIIENPMLADNYLVKMYVESLGIIGRDNDIGAPVYKILAKNSFKVGIAELYNSAQSIRIHFEVVEL
ncbi:hypothetical protein MW871_15110 [Flavobacterium sp. I-SCBP12n]|uniref:Uncharacterized protein n=1 Tax=Flavobacterium pygoscelis TaxID=2893176 RepID=A0A9X1XX11_9FLAO|nr:hypothetical protein [Flavobacterium pygoscelis]MCK8143218.1 hypothetical protein [Flavobacterium pygoscelis]